MIANGNSMGVRHTEITGYACGLEVVIYVLY